jgi:signal transduction histidine kinase
MSLRKKTFYLLSSIFMMAAIPLISYLSYSLFVAHEQGIERVLENESRQILRSLDRYFFERIGDIQILSEYDVIRDPSSTRVQITAVLERFVKYYKTYDSISVLDAHGRTIAHSNQLHIHQTLPSSFPLSEVFQIKKYRIWYEFYEDRTALMRIAFPLFDPQGRPFRIILFEITLDRIQSLLNTFVSNRVEVHLYNGDGKLIYANVPTQKLSLFDAHPESLPLKNQILKHQLKPTSLPSNHLRESFSLLGISEGFRDFERGSWILLVEQEAGVALQEWRKVIISTLGVVFIGIIAIGFLLLSISTKISDPLILIANIANEIGKGNFKAVEQLPERHDELGILSRRIKEMVGQIQSSIDQIQREKETAQTAMAQAIEANKAKDSFLSVMSHEMRTPLNSIIGFGSILLESEIPETAKEHARFIVQSGNQLLLLVNDVLDYSKVAHGKMDFEQISFSVLEVVESTTALLAPSAHAKNIEVITEVPPNFPRNLIGDPHRFKQVISNFLSNAVKFTDSGWIRIRLESEFSTTDPLIQISIEDTGIGILPEQIPHLFNPFTQADSSISRKFGGSGLGLAICKKFIDAWNGTIHVESHYQKGSRFSFQLSLPFDPTPSAPFPLPLGEREDRLLIFDPLPESLCGLQFNLDPFLQVQTTQDFEKVIDAIQNKRAQLILVSIPLNYSQIPTNWYKVLFSSDVPILLLAQRSLKLNLPTPHRVTEKPPQRYRLLKIIAEMIALSKK